MADRTLKTPAALLAVGSLFLGDDARGGDD